MRLDKEYMRRRLANEKDPDRQLMLLSGYFTCLGMEIEFPDQQAGGTTDDSTDDRSTATSGIDRYCPME